MPVFIQTYVYIILIYAYMYTNMCIYPNIDINENKSINIHRFEHM